MAAVPDWGAPTQFDLTNPYNTSMSFNVQTASGIYLFDPAGCSLDFTIRSTTDNVPQSDGSILHTRFLTGANMPLTVQLWQDLDTVACDSLLREMLDNLSGALRSLINAGDNEGRIAWEVDGGNERILDDARLLVYPTYQEGSPGVVTFTLDSKYPYAQNLSEATPSAFSNGASQTLVNTGTAAYFPVFKVNQIGGVVSAAAVSAFTIENLTTGEQFVYDDTFPGAAPISAGGHYAEITTFTNTIYLDGDGANLKAGVDELNSEYFPFEVGSNEIKITGCDMDILWAPAWG